MSQGYDSSNSQFGKNAVIPAGMPKSSVQGWQIGGPIQVSPVSKDVKLLAGKLYESNTCATDWLPSMAWISASMPK